MVAVIVTHFKEFTEWVQKGWDKLKNFLGFKNEHKDELEAPIQVGVEQTEQINKVTTISTIADATTTVKPSYQVDNSSQKELEQILKGAGIEGMELNPELYINPEYQADFSNMEEMQEQLKGLENTFDFENLHCTMPDMTEELAEVTNLMQTGGTEAGNAFANALNSSGENVRTAMQNINSIIQSTLLNTEQMFLWGSNLVQSFINGMNSQKTMLMMTAASLASTVGDYVTYSHRLC